MASQSNQPLPDGYQLNHYTIEKLLSSGGFSIVYLARNETGEPVAIKEYLPAVLGLRSSGAAVLVNSEENRAVFRRGLKCFFEEGRSLAAISHPNIVRVENFFRANETVYMVMKYVRGRTLQFHIQRHRCDFTENFIRRFFTYLLNGLREVHAKKLLHLDIKPANIYVTIEGNPVLLDFGAARQALSNDTQNLRPMYTAGYAAPEQYRGLDQLGPWTDIYAVGATLYTALTGIYPPPADEREKGDQLVPLKSLIDQAYSTDLIEIIEWCMKLDYLARPQTAYELQKALVKDVTELKYQQGESETSLVNKIRATLNKRIF